MKINITLKDITEVNVDGFECTYTYDGLIEDRPNYNLNNEIFSWATFPSDWGQRKVRKIKPTEEDLNHRLKPIIYSAWLNSYSTIDKNANGSELVVIWFGDYPNNKKIEDIIYFGIMPVDWIANAKDYYV